MNKQNKILEYPYTNSINLEIVNPLIIKDRYKDLELEPVPEPEPFVQPTCPKYRIPENNNKCSDCLCIIS